jgi:AcrR family transcriptional regulator
MSPKTEKQFADIRREKKELISRTALQLFATHGYGSTSISSIAMKAGISKGLLYNYFSGKEELLKEIMLTGLRNFSDFLKVENSADIKKEELIRFIDGNLTSLKQNADYYKLYFSLALQPGIQKLFEKEMMDVFGKVLDVFTAYFTKKGERSPYVKARFMLAVFDGIGVHYLADPENFPVDEVRKMILEQL